MEARRSSIRRKESHVRACFSVPVSNVLQSLEIRFILEPRSLYFSRFLPLCLFWSKILHCIFTVSISLGSICCWPQGVPFLIPFGKWKENFTVEFSFPFTLSIYPSCSSLTQAHLHVALAHTLEQNSSF